MESDRNQQSDETAQLHLMGDPAEVEAQAAQFWQMLDVVEESDSTPQEDDPSRVRRVLTVRQSPAR